MHVKQNYQQFHAWLQTNLGNYVSRQEYSLLADILNDILVKNILVLGDEALSLTDNALLTERNKKISQFILRPYLEPELMEFIVKAGNQDQPKVECLVAREDKLPIDSESIDAVVLPHTLEMVTNPHEVLRESHRILRPDGKIIITGFKYLSIWGLWRLLAKFISGSPWQNNFISTNKLIDWLSLLGFDELTVNQYCYNLPINNQKILNTCYFLERIGDFLPLIAGNLYTICGCKRIIPLSRIFVDNLVGLPVEDELPKHSFD